MMSVESIRAEIARLEGELASIRGEPLSIRSRGGDRDAPPGGALLEVSWATEDHSYVEWYATMEAAKAALLMLSRREGRAPEVDGLSVDLTARGCLPSSARIVGRSL